MFADRRHTSTNKRNLKLLKDLQERNEPEPAVKEVKHVAASLDAAKESRK